MRNAFKIGKLFSIEIRLDYSWFVIFLLVTWSLSTGHFPMYQWPALMSWAVGIVASLFFFASILAHELGHSFIAVRRNVPVKSITLFIFGGIAQLAKEPGRPLDEFLIAIAGPVVSASLGFAYLGIPALFFADANTPVAAVGLWLGTVNLTIAVFNLIPGFPLDGGRVLRSVIWGVTGKFNKATQIASAAGQFVAYAFIFTGMWLFFAGRVGDGLWIGFIGWFLNNAALTQYAQVTLKEQLAGITARDAMTAGIMFGRTVTPFQATRTIDADMNLFEVIRFMNDENIDEAPVAENGRILGMISRDRLLHFIAVRAQLGKAA